nr:phospholipase D-like domain-containing protein [uncultured Pseudomonas sp.]
MRKHAVEGDVRIHAIAGSHVVTFGFDWPERRADELQGFALHRTDHLTGQADWIEAQKRYHSTDPGTARGERVSTRFHPVQSFLWADYSVQPDREYTYRVVALGGTPLRLKELGEANVSLRTASTTASGHTVHFNRGAVAAQEYARRFKNNAPEDVTNGKAFEWLSRGLCEALTGFIDDAQQGDALYVAIYEARHDTPLEALARAVARGVRVQIVFDAKDNGSADEPPFPRDENLNHLEAHGLLDVATARSSNPSYIAHNKFIVLERNGGPESVWTGSTNWSENGFYGQLNVGHVVRDPTVAASFLEYWQLLQQDLPAERLRDELQSAFPVRDSWPAGTSAVFSPLRGREALDRYIDATQGAEAVLITLAFSLDDQLSSSLKTESTGLRYVLMDGIKGKKAQVEKISKAVRDIRATEAGRVAIGAYLRGNALDQFLVEHSNAMASHVQYIHTKFLLVDPLGGNPVVITGSANFSDASCNKNDENMLVIAGDHEVADIYLGEFMRSYSHYAFRDAVESARKAGRPFEPKPLNEDCSWAQEHYGSGFKSRQRRYFAHGSIGP